MVEQGKFSLDKSINEYLPYHSPIDENGAPVKVTIEQLLNHTSGLPDFPFKMIAWLHMDEEPRYGDTKMVKERLQDYRVIKSTLGTVSKYGNINYVLLGALLEAVTGNIYENHVKNNISLPLKMNDSDFNFRPDRLAKVVKGTHYYYHFLTLFINHFGPNDGLDGMTLGIKNNRHWLKNMHTDYVASTSIIGTDIDLSRFAQMLLNKGELDGVRLLSEENVNKILFGGRQDGQKKLVTEGEKEFALGYGTKTWFDQDVELIGHGGNGPGYTLQYFVVQKKDMVVVVLLNHTLQSTHDIAKVVASVF